MLAGVFGALEPSPVLPIPSLAHRLGVGFIYAKVETGRPLGSFKSLGGTFGAVAAIAR